MSAPDRQHRRAVRDIRRHRDGRFQHRRRLRAAGRQHGRRASEECGLRALSRQGRRPGDVSLFRRRDGPAGARAPTPDPGPARVSGQEGADPTLSTLRQLPHRLRDRLRGPDPVDPPHPRACLALRLHPPGGRKRAHRPHRHVGHRRCLPRSCEVADGAARLRQHISGTVPQPQPAADHPRRPDANRASRPRGSKSR